MTCRAAGGGPIYAARVALRAPEGRPLLAVAVLLLAAAAALLGALTAVQALLWLLAAVEEADCWPRLVASACGAVLAETVSLPVDVARVRMQLRRPDSAGTGGAPYRGLVDCLRRSVAEEGCDFLWRGLAPALARQVCYTSLCMLLYEPLRECYGGHLGMAAGVWAFLPGVAAGATSGALAIALCNPVDVVKTQLQSGEAGSQSAAGVVQRLWAAEGLAGFWAGVLPNVARSSLSSAAELGSYSHVLTLLSSCHGPGSADPLVASVVAALCSACLCTPADVVKTRLMGAAGLRQPSLDVFQTAANIVSEEGVWALYKGFEPTCARKLIWCSLFFVSYEGILATIQSF